MKKCERCSVDISGHGNLKYCSATCRRADKRDRNRKYRGVDKMTCVYYLPEEHYIGITTSPYLRMKEHRRSGKITDGYEVLCWYERRVDAHLLETMFHVRGYRGFRNLI